MSLIKIKNTPARLAINELFNKSDAPIDVSQIMEFLKSKKLNTNKVTVYRILDFLYKNKLIDRVEFGEGKYRYELQKYHHHHLICTTCGEIEDVEGESLADLENKIRKENNFIVKSHSLEFYGLCKNCQK